MRRAGSPSMTGVRTGRVALTAVGGAAVITAVVALTSDAPLRVLAVVAAVALAVLVVLLSLSDLAARRTRAQVTGIEDTAIAVRLSRDVDRGLVPVDEAWWPAARGWATHVVRPRAEDRVAVVAIVVLVVVELYGAISSGDARSYTLPAVLVVLAGGAAVLRRRTRARASQVLAALELPEASPS
ncbi:MAG: hypothetical protein ABI181_11640 [Mycobacteriaceae bacterium]